MFIYVRNGNRDFFQYIRLHIFDVSFLVRLGRKELPQILEKLKSITRQKEKKKLNWFQVGVLIFSEFIFYF